MTWRVVSLVNGRHSSGLYAPYKKVSNLIWFDLIWFDSASHRFCGSYRGLTLKSSSSNQNTAAYALLHSADNSDILINVSDMLSVTRIHYCNSVLDGFPACCRLAYPWLWSTISRQSCINRSIPVTNEIPNTYARSFRDHTKHFPSPFSGVSPWPHYVLLWRSSTTSSAFVIDHVLRS